MRWPDYHRQPSHAEIARLMDQYARAFGGKFTVFSPARNTGPPAGRLPDGRIGRHGRGEPSRPGLRRLGRRPGRARRPLRRGCVHHPHRSRQHPLRTITALAERIADLIVNDPSHSPLFQPARPIPNPLSNRCDPGADVTPALMRALLALAVLAGGLVTVASPASLRELSEDQRRRLAAGEVIVRDTLPPGASESARGGTALALVRASPEQVWSVLVDYPGHSRYYPRVVAAEVVGGDERRVLVRYQVGIGPFAFAFHMDKFPDPRRRRIDWHLADGHSPRPLPRELRLLAGRRGRRRQPGHLRHRRAHHAAGHHHPRRRGRKPHRDGRGDAQARGGGTRHPE